jgi:hypothetical protein
MYSSSNDKELSLKSDSYKTSSSSIQDEEAKSANLEKLDVPVLAEQKQVPWMKMIALPQAPMMMTLMMKIKMLTIIHT